MPAKRSKSLKPGHYYCETFRMNYYYFICWPYEKFHSYMLKNFDYDAGPESNGKSAFDRKDSIVCIWTSGLKGKEGKGATLVHECIHAACFTLESRGIDARNDAGETLAYLTESIFRNAL